MANKHGIWTNYEKNMAEQVIYLLHKYDNIDDIIEAMEEDFENDWLKFRDEILR